MSAARSTAPAPAAGPPDHAAHRDESGHAMRATPEGRDGGAADPPGPPAHSIPDAPDRAIADMTGAAALPRRNGELVFDSAWEGRLFGMTLALHAAGLFTWNDFRDRLIREIAAGDRSGSPTTYYDRWFRTFERVLEGKALVSAQELAARVAEFESGRRDDVF